MATDTSCTLPGSQARPEDSHAPHWASSRPPVRGSWAPAHGNVCCRAGASVLPTLGSSRGSRACLRKGPAPGFSDHSPALGCTAEDQGTRHSVQPRGSGLSGQLACSHAGPQSLPRLSPSLRQSRATFLLTAVGARVTSRPGSAARPPPGHRPLSPAWLGGRIQTPASVPVWTLAPRQLGCKSTWQTGGLGLLSASSCGPSKHLASPTSSFFCL